MGDDKSVSVPIKVVARGIDHLAAVDAIMRTAFDPKYGEAWNSAQVLSTLAIPGYQLRGAFVVEAEQYLAGFAITRVVARESELLLLAVDPQWQRVGVASALLNDWLATCDFDGVTMAFLEMREDNPAKSLYQAFGFAEAAIRTSYYRGGDGVMRNALTMNRRLVDGHLF
jgi:ribosomal-protein-alanine N-acetyltransferase